MCSPLWAIRANKPTVFNETVLPPVFGPVITIARVPGLGSTSKLLSALAAEYEQEGRGFLLAEIAGGWQLRSRPEYAAEVARLRQSRPKSRFSRSAMETLAIVAYRQPIQRSEIELVRGVDCGAPLKNLMSQGM